jgi:hypothetical protein
MPAEDSEIKTHRITTVGFFVLTTWAGHEEKPALAGFSSC